MPVVLPLVTVPWFCVPPAFPPQSPVTAEELLDVLVLVLVDVVVEGPMSLLLDVSPPPSASSTVWSSHAPQGSASAKHNHPARRVIAWGA